MAYKVQFANNHSKKFLKKLKDDTLKNKFLDLIYDDIAIDPYSGDSKQGDLKTIYTKSLIYKKVQYRVGYEVLDDNTIVLLLLIGTRENFYKELKRLL